MTEQNAASARINDALGRVIRHRRIKLGWSQQDLAGFSGYAHRTTINNIECGHNAPTIAGLYSIAEAMHTTPSSLLRAAEKRLA